MLKSLTLGAVLGVSKDTTPGAEPHVWPVPPPCSQHPAPHPGSDLKPGLAGRARAPPGQPREI